MRSTHFPNFAILLVLILAGILVISASLRSPASAQELIEARAQITATPVLDDQSVIGSTDGIVIMGFVIVLITTIPMLFRRKK